MSKLPYIAFALAAGFFVGTITQAKAEPITFSICEGKALTFKQPKGSDKLHVYCPGRTPPAFTLNGCIGPRVRKVGTQYTVTCERLIQYTEGTPVLK
jgi:hypothetical protein